MAERQLPVLVATSLLIGVVDAARLAAVRGRDIALIVTLDCGAASTFCAGRRNWIGEHHILLFNILGFIFAPLPALSPIADKKFEAKRINFHARLEANTQVSVVHLVLVRVGKEKGKVAGNGEKKIVIEGREVGQLVDEHLRNCHRAGTLTRNALLNNLGEKFVGKSSQPVLEHGTNDVDIV